MAPTNKGRNRAAAFDSFVESAPADFDPEVDELVGASSEDDDDVAAVPSDDEARAHYVDVGKSKLRRPKDVPLGLRYRGERVGREDIGGSEDEDDAERWEKMDEESESEEMDNEEEDDVSDDGSEDDEEEEEEDGSDSEEKDDGHAQTRLAAPNASQKIRMQKLAKEENSVATALSKAAQADVEKGRAVRKQRSAFDSLLNTRIKLQKTLVGANTIVGFDADQLATERGEASEAAAAAEAAAFTLWASLNELREDLLAIRSGSKRKRNPFTVTSRTEKLWKHMQEQEERSRPYRDLVLKKWSDKTQEAASLPKESSLRKANGRRSIVQALQEHLAGSDHLIKRTRTPRSCAPKQLDAGATEDERIYDDADFYGLLLKELLEQKSADSVAAANVDFDFGLRREAKTKKNVDTKASKGRKLRYVVHEKLQNFMAPEDRRTWGERQADELFGSLFGRRMGLGEGDEEVDGAGTVEGIDVNGQDGAENGADAALLMFRS